MISKLISKRVQNLPPYLFVEISRKIAEKKARGEEVISFAIGDPDIPTPPHIIDRLCQATKDPANHRYPETDGLPELRRAIAEWYQKRFGVNLDPDKEVLPLIGAKEGIAHIAFCFIDAGDIALVTDPAYPVYAVSTMLAGGEVYYLPLFEKNNYLPDLESIPAEIMKKAKLLWINYPNNPTGAVAELDFFNRVVEFARRHDLAICHDGPYTEVAFDGYQPVSFMQVQGAKEVGVESMGAGIVLAQWFADEWDRIKTANLPPESDPDDALLDYLVAQGGESRRGDVVRHVARYRNTETLDAALARLGKAGLLHVESRREGSRGPSTEWVCLTGD